MRPFHLLRLTEGVLQLAGRFTTPQLGTLDAIHIASALAAEAGELVTFDRRQGSAAEVEGVIAVTPGGGGE